MQYSNRKNKQPSFSKQKSHFTPKKETNELTIKETQSLLLYLRNIPTTFMPKHNLNIYFGFGGISDAVGDGRKRVKLEMLLLRDSYL
ncbi:CLUMA_CG016692, isoform A [Clunio marinus]|uniref:CLUMA_CG016692, isoform A n=1 Tax=Clunio marinus TaxID=568069 RepID=A0A1J1ISU9_9DIPT|nr:CLUMA_CG016692, isoform A [Clunio marinus]